MIVISEKLIVIKKGTSTNVSKTNGKTYTNYKLIMLDSENNPITYQVKEELFNKVSENDTIKLEFVLLTNGRHWVNDIFIGK